jgi:hypothetical protein
MLGVTSGGECGLWASPTGPGSRERSRKRVSTVRLRSLTRSGASAASGEPPAGRTRSRIPPRGGAMLMLPRVRRDARLWRRPETRRRFPPASKCGLLAACIFVRRCLCGFGKIGPPTRSSMPSCSRPSRTLRAAKAVARRRVIPDCRCARRLVLRAGRDGRMVPIEQKDGTQEMPLLY